MDRLTRRGKKDRKWVLINKICSKATGAFRPNASSCDQVDNRTCPYLEVVDRLCEYEDTNREPSEIERLKAERRWIPVTERLPEETECGTDVLVAIKYGDELDSDKTITCCGYLLDGEWWTYREHDCGRVGSKPLNKGDKVVYWMPLPEPPKKGE